MCSHDGDGSKQHIATIYDHEEAHEVVKLWNSPDLEQENAMLREALTKCVGWTHRAISLGGSFSMVEAAKRDAEAAECLLVPKGG